MSDAQPAMAGFEVSGQRGERPLAPQQLQEITAMISNRIPGLALAAALMAGVAGSANAAEPRGAVPQLAGISTDLGHNASALTYWVDEADGFHVVTTIDTVVGSGAVPEQSRHAVVRFSALILPGESQVISVPGPVGSQPQALRIRRLANQFGAGIIEVDRIPAPEIEAGNGGLTN